MSSYKTRGIIIKRSNMGEADRILTIYTDKLGKIRVVAKGIRKIKSKLAGSLELFCLTNFVIAEGRNLDIVTAAEIEKCFFDLRNNLPKTQKAFYLGELVEKLTEDNDPNEEIYNLLDAVLENINTDQSDILISFFEFNLLTEIGYHPELMECLNCRTEISESKKNYFNYEHGGLVCVKCKKGEIEISNSAIKLLRLFLKHRLNSVKKVKISDKILREVEYQTRSFLNQISDKEFKTQRFLK